MRFLVWVPPARERQLPAFLAAGSPAPVVQLPVAEVENVTIRLYVVRVQSQLDLVRFQVGSLAQTARRIRGKQVEELPVAALPEV